MTRDSVLFTFPTEPWAVRQPNVSTEREIIMSKFFQKTLVLSGSAALIALMSAAPASAQGVPAGLLRLDPPQSASNSFAEVEQPHAKIRNAYARARKIQPHQHQ